MESLVAAFDWLRDHPAFAIAAVVAFLGVVWFLRRPDPVLKEGAKEFDRLTKKNKGRYDDLRPLK
jgi:hypothetical protein